MTTTPCWICGSALHHEWKTRGLPSRLAPEDLQITDAHYGRTLRLLQCDQCSFIFADANELEELSQLYANLVDEGYLESSEARRIQMRSILHRVRRHVKAQSLLDVGCATGALLEEATAAGMQATGIEPSRAMVSHAANKGLRVVQGSLPSEELQGERFDLVCLVDVIEHVSDPVSLLRASAAHVRPSGGMLVVTPDVGSLTAKLLGPRWWHLRVAHVGYFDRYTMRRAAEAAGLRVDAMFRPWWFFPANYLVERVRHYAPAPRWLESVLGSQVIPLQLGDSWAFVLRKAA